jgi:starvation-inducible DNA-binding protein
MPLAFCGWPAHAYIHANTGTESDPMQHATSIDIPSNSRTAVIETLNARLADLTDLKLATKHAHWNVKGRGFIGLHEMFDKFAATLDGHIDTVAERVTALGGTAKGTLAQTVAGTSQAAFPTDVFEGLAMVKALAAAYAEAGKRVRDGIDETEDADADTADVLTAVSRDLDKALWFMEAHLQG